MGHIVAEIIEDMIQEIRGYIKKVNEWENGRTGGGNKHWVR